MARNKKSLKSLFSKSELNLKDSSEKDESSARSKTFKFFTWRRKKRTPGETTTTDRMESPEPSTEDWPDDDQRTSIYATAPRSKMLLSRSETDLHKRKGFSSFSLGWRKKKKKMPLAESIASINTESDVNDQTREQHNEEQEEMVENQFSQPVHCEEVEPESTANLPSFIFTDQLMEPEEVPERGESASSAFSPITLDGTFISYIDSDSDGYHTPPESPGMEAMTFFHAQTDIGVVGQSPSESVSTSFNLFLETNQEILTTTNMAPPKGQKDPVSTADFTAQSDDGVQTILETSTFPVDNSAESTSPASIMVSSSSSHQKGCQANISTAAYSWGQSTTLQPAQDLATSDKIVGNIMILDSPSKLSEREDAESAQDHTESNNLNRPAPSHDKQDESQNNTNRMAGEIDQPSEILPTEMFLNNTDGSTQGTAYPGLALKDESDSVPMSLNLPFLPEVSLSNSELPSLSLGYQSSEIVSVVDTFESRTDSNSTDATDSNHSILAAVTPVCHSFEPVQLQDFKSNTRSMTGDTIKNFDLGSTKTTKTNLSTMMYSSSDHNPNHAGALLSSSDSALRDDSNLIPKPLDLPVLPEVKSSNTELSSLSIGRHNSDRVSACDTFSTNTEPCSADVTDSNQPILADVKPSSHDFEENQNISSETEEPIKTFDSGSLYTNKTNLLSTIMYNPSHEMASSFSGDSNQSSEIVSVVDTFESRTDSNSTDATDSNQSILAAVTPVCHSFEPVQLQDFKSNTRSMTGDTIKNFDLGSTKTTKTNLSIMMYSSSDHNPNHAGDLLSSSDSVLRDDSNVIPNSLYIPVLPEVISSNTELSNLSLGHHKWKVVSATDTSKTSTESTSNDVTNSVSHAFEPVLLQDSISKANISSVTGDTIKSFNSGPSNTTKTNTSSTESNSTDVPDQPVIVAVKSGCHGFEPIQLQDKLNITLKTGDPIKTFDSDSSYTTKTNVSSKESFSTDVTDSNQPFIAVNPLSCDNEPVRLQDSDCKSNISLPTEDNIKIFDSVNPSKTMAKLSPTMMYTHTSGLDHSRKEPVLVGLVPPESAKVTNNISSLEYTATDHLPTCPDIHHHTPSGLSEQQEVNMSTHISLRTNQAGERHEEEQILSQGQNDSAHEPVWKSVTLANDSESVESFNAKSVQARYNRIDNSMKASDEFIDPDEPVWKSVTLVKDSESVESNNAKSVQMRYSESNTSVEALDEVQLNPLEEKTMGEEHFARNQSQELTIVKQGQYKAEARAEAQQYPEAQDQSGRESKTLAGEAPQQLTDLAITKLDTPVLRERMLEECMTAAPWSPNREASITDCNPAAHTDLGAGYSPSLAMLSGSMITLQEHRMAGGGAKGSAANLHAEREESTTTQEQVTHSENSRASEGSQEDLKVSKGEGKDLDYTEAQDTSILFKSFYIAEATPKTIRDSFHSTSVPIPPETDFQDTCSTKAEATVGAGRHFQLSGGVSHLSLHSETAASSTVETSRTLDERGTATPGVVVYLKEFGLDNSEEEAGGHQNFTPAVQFSHVFSVLSTVEEESDTESALESPSESDTEMSSGIGVLSTTLTLKPKGSLESREDGKRVHKVSLVSNSSSSNSGHVSGENGLKDEIKTNGGIHESVSIWTSQREDLNSIPEESTSSILERSRSHYLSDNDNLYSSLSSSSYVPTSYSSFSYSTYSSEAQPSSVSIDTTDSLSNSSWRNLRSEVQLSSESEAGRRSWEEPITPAGQGERGREREGGITNTGSDSHAQRTEQSDSYFSGVFKATRVELPSSPTDAAPDLEPDTSMPASPHDMDTLLDTLKSMGPPVRHRTLRNSSSQPFSSLPPIVEDAPSPSSAPLSSPTSPDPKPLSSLPPDLGLNWNSVKDMRSPLTMMKDQQASELPNRSLILPSRASAISSLVMRKNSLPDLTSEDGSLNNGGAPLGSSRLDHSLIFSSYRSEQDVSQNGTGLGHRSLFRTASLPEVNTGHDRLSMPPKGMEQLGSGTSRLERLSFLTSPPGSLTGLNEMSSRMSVSPSFLHNSVNIESPTFNHTPPSSLELFRTFSPESPVKHPTPPSLQRSLSAEGNSAGSPVFNGVVRGFGAPQEQGTERNFLAKYRAFPDAYLTKEKEHGKLNPRPGKMLIFNRPGLRGQRTEIRGDIMDATAWQFPENISIRVVRGGWVLYEKPDFKGEKIALDEGDIELAYPWGPPEDGEDPTQNGTQGSEEDSSEPKPPARKQFVIGSLRRAVRDYSVPEICLFPEENAEGKKIVFRDTSEDARIFGFPIKANSIIINAGLWLVFAEPFFQGDPKVLEVGGFTNPAAWGVTQPYISSLHPLKIGEPKVEKPNEPKLVIYEKPYFTGKSREIYTNSRDFMTREGNQHSAFMFNAGSIKVIGGIWVGYEKEGFRGHQYLLEEGEYHDWRVWGGCDSELRSVRVIRTDLSQPTLVMFEMTTEEEEQEEQTFEVTEAVPDVELFGFRPATRSIHVLSGAWVAYSHVDYSGHQYVLEKGFYNNCADWGSEDNRICSIQPILQAPANGPSFLNEFLLYSEPGFQGRCQTFSQNHESLPESLPVQSCRVVGGSWVLYDGSNYMGNQYVLSEGDYANFTSIGCPANYSLCSIKSVPMLFSVPSISLFGLECFEGREVTVESEVSNMIEEGFNPHVLSVRVNSGCWVLCEHTNYRGRQYLLEPIEITNWHKFSSLSTIGSMYPIRAKRKLFRIRYKKTGHYMSVQGGVDTMKSGRVVVSEQIEGMSDIWFYQDGLLKNKLAPTMSLQVMGTVESGAKVVLWSETRTPIQRWSAQLNGAISSLTFPGLVLDVKGGKTYDKEHVIVQSEGEESDSQLWELELL